MADNEHMVIKGLTGKCRSCVRVQMDGTFKKDILGHKYHQSSEITQAGLYLANETKLCHKREFDYSCKG